MIYPYNGVLFSYKEKFHLQKSLSVMEMKYTLVNEIRQTQKDCVLLVICGNLKELVLNIEEEFTGTEKATRVQKSEEMSDHS